MNSSSGKPPVVEPAKVNVTLEVTLRALQQRIRQQEILSELSVLALQGADTAALLDEAARLSAEGLRTSFCKVLEYLPDEACFVVRAGVGWGPDVVGAARVGSDLASPAGFALKTGKPVISNHLENEQRFRTPDLLKRHGIRRAMNVILQGDGQPYGVLEVDSRSEDDFSPHDIAFLQGVANILGMAVERTRFQTHLQYALERHQVLLKEMNHRVKNSLSVVSSLLRLQARANTDPIVEQQLEEAAQRVHAVARAHERLYQSDSVERIDVGQYVEKISTDIDASVSNCEIVVDTEEGITIETDRAIALALIVNELIINAAKHAYPSGTVCKVWVTVALDGQAIAVSVRDQGVGLPADFDPARQDGLGMRIVSAFVKQLGATLTVRQQSPGAEFRIAVPHRHGK